MDFVDRPPVLLASVAFALMWLAAIVGAQVRKKWGEMDESSRQELNVILAGSLTILGLLIGFTFSMAVGRYDLRKNYEEQEANAIGTEYLRVSLLPSPEVQNARSLLRSYLDQRILFYTTRDPSELDRIDRDTLRLQNELWKVVQSAGLPPTAVMGLIASGMNDVINMQGWVQAVWWNRIPSSAWLSMLALGVISNVLFSYSTLGPEPHLKRFGVIPMILAIAFFLSVDIESPRHGTIRVAPQNLIALEKALAVQ